ncbi:MAG TPA: HPF/RaiA family ribosome-associated protein [Anaeromyxobacter sp.]|nr:HPF/RaiA family ribosome-associated protein [Anaeromyxobacter sp.]
MKIQVRFQGLQHSESLAEWATHRADRLLHRFGGQVRSLEVRITDTNGPRRGGVDKRCQVIAMGPRIGVVRLAETHEDPYASVELAVFRARRSIGRALQRGRGGDEATIRRPDTDGPHLAA